ncbi:MAG: hypothetical protein J6W48_02980 [Lachnospiraceae bacterium]|nr:hypothetical protein [Lachnospiraceae bacterium]
MAEKWDVYTIDRKLTGKTCLRGEQGNLSDDEFHLWVMVWIKNPVTGKYLVSQRVADRRSILLNGKPLPDIPYREKPRSKLR